MVNKQEDSEIYECSDCGAEVDNDAEACPKCGAIFKDQLNVKSTDDNKHRSKGSKLIGIIITIFAIIIASSINPLINYFSNSDSIEYSDYDDWEKVTLYNIGITLKTPSKLNREESSFKSDVMNSIIYSGGMPGLELIVLGSTIKSGYYYDLEKGAVGSMNHLERDGNLNNLNYEMSEWNWTDFENKVIRGTYSANGEKGELISLFGKKNDKMFSVVILISPINQRALDLGHLLLNSVVFI